MKILLALTLASPLLLAACGEKTPSCPLCYEDAWSKTPFPGQDTHHVGTLNAEKVMEQKTPTLNMPTGQEFPATTPTISSTTLNN